ncbi:uncharacterized protein LOC125515815 isoform X2 [Triticum urartu]|uniref:uncharacterized protein LOC125515815 isoform X2 n=1 Tax=Triticum urartu TaxID=4572 RepID=UPI002043AE77|nr:uncharacterized protein LOC125515815 isoform X2 [Triticum urartu]
MSPTTASSMASSTAAETSSVLRAPPSLHILYCELDDGGGVLLADVMLNFLVKLLELPAMHAKRQQLAAQFFLYCQDGRGREYRASKQGTGDEQITEPCTCSHQQQHE